MQPENRFVCIVNKLLIDFNFGVFIFFNRIQCYISIGFRRRISESHRAGKNIASSNFHNRSSVALLSVIAYTCMSWECFQEVFLKTVHLGVLECV